MHSRKVIVVGGGAAGFFAAITCAEAAPDAEVTVLERGPRFLDKVRISGGGRCNVTHACFDARELTSRFPRGGRALLAPFKKFQASDTVAWFESRGVKLKTEDDGRMFPVSDSSQTIMNCLMNAAKAAGVKLRLNCGVERVAKLPESGFEVVLTTERRSPTRRVPATFCFRAGSDQPSLGSFGAARTGAPMETLACDRLLLATGGCRAAAAGQLAVSLGHTLEAPVPSLFTFHIATPWLRELAGVSVEPVEASVPAAKLRERGALLVTHWGLSG
ncbi:MAG: NAD(P)/FAD-dependent oxidoreductase, partial [Verrucomicrobiota bacterium]